LYKTNPFNGAGLPAKTLCLTFDDGPGNHTIEIARFLFQHQIKATFFVVGKYALHHQDILLQLKEMNHLIGNHTYDHPDLPYYVSTGGNVLDQVLRTDAIIKPFIEGERVYFRAPYGKWSAEVAKELNQHILTTHHIGPVHWEVAGVDVYYWQNDWLADAAADRYLTDINRSERGIIVMHDDIADMDTVKPRHKTLDLLKLLIPKLKEQGYDFVRLDEIPLIKEASAQKLTFTLRTSTGKYVSLKNKFDLYLDAKPENPKSLLQLKHLSHGKIAIKAVNNCYLSIAGNPDNEVTANRPEIGATEMFDLIPVNASGVMLRCTDGKFLNITKGKLTFNAQYMRQAVVFSYANHNLAVQNNISLNERFLLLKKQLLFIKSKLQQKV